MKKLVIAFGVVFVFTCGLLIGKTFFNTNNNKILTEEEVYNQYIESEFADYMDHEYTLDVYEVEHTDDNTWVRGYIYKDGSFYGSVGFNYAYYANQAANARNS